MPITSSLFLQYFWDMSAYTSGKSLPSYSIKPWQGKDQVMACTIKNFSFCEISPRLLGLHGIDMHLVTVLPGKHVVEQVVNMDTEALNYQWI
jgi:hypothetical protein